MVDLSLSVTKLTKRRTRNMKTYPHITLSLAVCASCAIPLLSASAEQNHFYVKADAGGAITSDTRLKEYFGPVAPNSKIRLDPGGRFALHGGYGVTDWFDVEVETGVIANHIDSVTGATETRANLANVPLLLNARFHGPDSWVVSPYFGGGLGGSTTFLNAHDLTIGGTRMRGTASDTVFAYQAFGGVRVALNDHMGISAEYHYFASTDSDMRADVTSGTASRHLRLDGLESHTFSVAFDYKF